MANQGGKMATGIGCLVLKPARSHHHPKQPSEDAIVSMDISNSSTPCSTSAKSCTRTAELPESVEKQRGSKTKKGKSGNTFNTVGNTFTSKKSDRVGVFGFGNTNYVCNGPKKGKRDESGGETDSQSSSDDEEKNF